MLKRARSRGLSLVELLVGMAIGTLLVTGALRVYGISLQGSSTSSRLVQLNQGLRAIANAIDYDVRRAGYSAGVEAGAPTNPFTRRAGIVTDLNVSADNLCVLYAFDLDMDGVVDDGEITGFRFNAAASQVEVLNQAAAPVLLNTSAGADCSGRSWLPMNLPALVKVTAASFSTQPSQCLAFDPASYDTTNASTWASWTNASSSGAACENPPAGTTIGAALTRRAELRVVTVTLTAEHARDPSIRRTLTHTIRVRNDRSI